MLTSWPEADACCLEAVSGGNGRGGGGGGGHSFLGQCTTGKKCVKSIYDFTYVRCKIKQ